MLNDDAQPTNGPPRRFAAVFALTTLGFLLIGGLIVGSVVQQQVLGLKEDMPRFVAEEIRSQAGIDGGPGLLNDMVSWFLDLDTVEDFQGRIETRAIRQSTAPILGTYLAVTAAATLGAWLIGREMDARHRREWGRLLRQGGDVEGVTRA